MYQNYVSSNSLPISRDFIDQNVSEFVGYLWESTHIEGCHLTSSSSETYEFKNRISKVGFTDQLWIDSDDFSLEIELISHQKETKVHLQNELWRFYLYLKILLNYWLMKKEIYSTTDKLKMNTTYDFHYFILTRSLTSLLQYQKLECW